MNKISLFLENLSLREKILFLVFLALLGIFLGFKSYEGYLKDFFDEIISLDEQELLEKKEQNFILQKDKMKLEKELELLKQSLESYHFKTQIFNVSYENYIAKLEQLTQKYKLKIKDSQSFENEEKYFKKYDLILQIEGEFEPLLEFIQELENSNPPFKLESIELENTHNLNLNLNLKIAFIIYNDTNQNKE